VAEPAAEPAAPRECKVVGCHGLVETDKANRRGLCEHHYLTRSDGRPRCKKCLQRFAAPPYATQLCELCNPEYTELNSYEMTVIQAMHAGQSPKEALQTVRPELSDAGARACVTRTKQKLSAKLRVKARAMGMDEEWILGMLKDNIVAETVFVGKDGEERVGVDRRSRNQALKLLGDMLGMFAGKPKQTPPETKVQIGVAMIPSQIPRDPAAPVYTLPTKAHKDEDPA